MKRRNGKSNRADGRSGDKEIGSDSRSSIARSRNVKFTVTGHRHATMRRMLVVG